MTTARRIAPGLQGIRDLDRAGLRRELVAGVTLLALAVPLNIGYAETAGLPPTAGLYALVVPAVLFALTASSRQVVAAPDAAAAALVASSLGGLAIVGSEEYLTLALTQAVLGGLVFLAMARFRLGFLADFLSEPILLGFVAGLALEVLVGQVGKMLGVPLGAGELLEKVRRLVEAADEVHPWSVAVSAVAVLVLVLGRRVTRTFPWALVALAVAGALTALLDLGERGVAVLGAVEPGLPPLTLPDLRPATVLAVLPSAVALTMVTAGQGLLMARTYSLRHGVPYDPDRDLRAYGVANLGAGLTGAFTVSSSVSRTAATDYAGARTQLPSVVAAVGTLLLLVVGAGLLEQVPLPAIGAVVALAVLPLLGVRGFRRLARLDRGELAVALVSLLGVLLLGPITGIVVAFVLSLVNLARRAASPAVDVLRADDTPGASLLDAAVPGEPTAPGVLVVRFAAPVFFANAGVLDDAVRRAVTSAGPGLRAVVLDLEAVTDVDVTGAERLGRLRRHLEEQGVVLAFSRVRPGIEERLAQLGVLAGATLHRTNRAAVAALRTDPPGDGTVTPEG